MVPFAPTIVLHRTAKRTITPIAPTRPTGALGDVDQPAKGGNQTLAISERTVSPKSIDGTREVG